LNDIETINFIVENQEQLNFLPEPSTSTSLDNDNNLIVENHNVQSCSVIVIDDNFLIVLELIHLLFLFQILMTIM